MALVNLLGDLSLEDTQLDIQQVLVEILLQLRIMNLHLSKLTDERITRNDVQGDLDNDT